MDTRQQGEALGTSQRLLEAAAAIFARRGYHEATIAEICEAAGANIAAVNYYFRHKENLYVEAWRHAFRRSTARYPPDGGVPSTAPAAERLAGQIRSILRRISDPECHEFEIVHKEMASPTGLLIEAMRESIGPIQSEFQAIVQELLGNQASEQDVQLCTMSIRSQCFAPMLRERRRRMSVEGVESPVPPLPEIDTAVYAEHVIRFSLAGLEAARRRLEHTAASEERA